MNEELLSYIRERPRTRTEIAREFRRSAAELDEALDNLKSQHLIKSRKIETSGRPQTIYLECKHESSSDFYAKIQHEKARRKAQAYINQYNIEVETCSIEGCTNKPSALYFKNLSNYKVVAFVCSECESFLTGEEIKDLAKFENLDDLRRAQPRTKKAASAYLRRYMDKYAIKNPPCQMCGERETLRYIPDTRNPLEACFMCNSCFQRFLSGKVSKPEPIDVLMLKERG